MKVKGKLKSLSPVRLLATPWTAAWQTPPPMGFSRQEYWSGVQNQWWNLHKIPMNNSAQRPSELDNTSTRREGGNAQLHGDRGSCAWAPSRTHPMYSNWPFLCILYLKKKTKQKTKTGGSKENDSQSSVNITAYSSLWSMGWVQELVMLQPSHQKWTQPWPPTLDSCI